MYKFQSCVHDTTECEYLIQAILIQYQHYSESWTIILNLQKFSTSTLNLVLYLGFCKVQQYIHVYMCN